MIMMEEDPFPDLKIDSTDFLDTLTGRSKCPKCEKSRKYYCYTCCVPLAEIKDKVPAVKLPIKVDIIKHPCEVDGKSTAVHAKVIAHDDVTIYTYPCIPDYDKGDKVLLVFPGKDAVTLKQLAELWLPACTKDKTDHITDTPREPAISDRQHSDKKVEFTVSNAARSSQVQEPVASNDSSKLDIKKSVVSDESTADKKREPAVVDDTITSELEWRSVKREAESHSTLNCQLAKKKMLDDNCEMKPMGAKLDVDGIEQRSDCDTCAKSEITLNSSVKCDRKHLAVSGTHSVEGSLRNTEGDAAADTTAVTNGNSTDTDAKCVNAEKLTVSCNSECPSASEDCSNSQEVFPTFRLGPGCPVERVVFIDSTWNQTRTICMDERLKGLRHVELQLQKTKFWRHQKDIPDTYLSTIEAIYYFLRDFHENFVQTRYSGEYDNLLFFFTFMYRKICGLYKGGSELKAYIQRKEGMRSKQGGRSPNKDDSAN